MGVDRTVFFPQVANIPKKGDVRNDADKDSKNSELKGEFDKAFSSEVGKLDQSSKLNQINPPVKFSAHAMQRLADRKISLTPETMGKLKDAVDKASLKGIDDTLILTPEAALIVNVKNRTVITALDRNAASGNVFTNIDGAVII